MHFSLDRNKVPRSTEVRAISCAAAAQRRSHDWRLLLGSSSDVESSAMLSNLKEGCRED